MGGLAGVKTRNRNQRIRRPVKDDGQLMLGLGCPEQRRCLPEPNRSQCICLLSKMLLCAINSKYENKKEIQP